MVVGIRNRVSSQNLVGMPKLSQKPGFLDCARVGVRNRVSSQNLGEDAKIIAETRFLGLSKELHREHFSI
jgi:hypothetical protein